LARALNSNSVTPATDRALLARACSRLAESQREAGILEPGESLLREAVALWDGLIAEQRHKWEYHAGRTLALHRLSRWFASARRWEESEGTFHDGVGLYERHLARFPFDIVTRSSLCGFYEERAQDLRAGGWHEGALDILTRSLREREEAVKYQPRFKATLMQLAAAGRQWSAAARQTGRTQEAWDAARRALQIYETLIQESPGDRRLTEVLRVARRELRSGADGNRE
jgi:tetratricopeptide (TPR) repeat protein